jgi:UPF0716 family protein affecting phage T7 exclusion
MPKVVAVQGIKALVPSNNSDILGLLMFWGVIRKLCLLGCQRSSMQSCSTRHVEK